MTLKEKLDTLKKYDEQDPHETFMTIADDYAIEFAEWILYQDITQRGKSNFVCTDGLQRSTKELLEIFKKEKGL